MTGATNGRSFLVLAANTPWVYALAQNLLAHGPVTAMRFYDWATHRRLKPEWPETESAVHRVPVIMPQGYAGTLEPVFRPLMRYLVDRERSRLRTLSGTEPIVICPYPYLAPWVRNVPDDRLLYYSLDEYGFYNPLRAAAIHAQEDQLVARAGLTICLSIHQAGVLRARHPRRADNIRHFPLGVALGFLNPDPTAPPEPGTIGYIGNLTNRVDWAFVAAVAGHCPEARFLFHGDLTAPGDASNGDWRAARERTFSLSNVSYEGNLRQREVAQYYWRYAINWMPYDTSNGFNIASCPTKIMDALASGRPFVSTDIPEVRLYDDRIRIVQTPEEAASALRSLLHGDRPHDARAQVEFAALNTWDVRAHQLVELLEETEAAGRSGPPAARAPRAPAAFAFTRTWARRANKLERSFA